MTHPLHQKPRAVLAKPLLLAVLSLVGLVIGLTGDGWRDVVAFLFVGAPVAALLRAWARARRTHSPRPEKFRT